LVCFTPLKAYRASGGRVVFSSKEGFGDRPLELPCGSCLGCLKKRGQEWALRCVHEASLHSRSCFVTLTYAPEHVPANGSVNVRDWQLFAKRMRRAGLRFRFLMAAEYGERNFRPHYHACIFGQDFGADRVPWRRRGEHVLYSSKLLEELWGLGFASVGSLSLQSASYVARYCLKKVASKVKTERLRRIDPRTGEEFYVRPEFATMSRRPGLGADWYERYKRDVFPSDEVVHDGKRHGVPNFYLKRLEAADPVLHLSLKAARLAAVAKRKDECSPERLRVREQVASGGLSVFRREL